MPRQKEICGAKRKYDGSPCQYPPDKSSTSGKCRFHGGASPKGMNSGRFKHGRRSKYAKEQVLEKIQKFRGSDDVRNLREELAILRGILHSYIENTDDLLESSSIDTLTKLTDKVEKVVSSLKVIEEGHTFTIKNVNNVILQIVKIIQSRIADPNVRTQIAQDIRKIAYISVN